MSICVEETVAAPTETKTVSDRDAGGRFAAGNKGGPGNPFGRRLAAMRETILNAVSEEDIGRIVRKWVEMAIDGDLAAGKLVMLYAVGKPKPVAEPDHVESEGWEIQQNSWVPAQKCTELMTGIPAEMANVMVDAVATVRKKEIGDVIVKGEPLPPVQTEDDELDDETPLSPEEIALAKREWEEAKARFAAMTDQPSLAEGNGAAAPSPAELNGEFISFLANMFGPSLAADQPSVAGSNGDTAPSLTGTNGDSKRVA